MKIGGQSCGKKNNLTLPEAIKPFSIPQISDDLGKKAWFKGKTKQVLQRTKSKLL